MRIIFKLLSIKRIIVVRYIPASLDFIDEFEISAVYYSYLYIIKTIRIHVRYTNYIRIKYEEYIFKPIFEILKK